MASVNAAYNDWSKGDEDAVSVETGVELLDELVRSCRGVDGTEAIVERARQLRQAYTDWNGDLDGERAMRLHEAYAEWRN